MSDTLHKISPMETPFLVLLNKIGKAPSQTEFGWMQDDDFNIRTFNCDFVVGAGGGDCIAYLKLRSPSDAQGFEAPPYNQLKADYDLSDIILFEISAYDAAWYTWWVILTKPAVEWVGKWRTVDVSASSVISGINAAVADPEGYFILIGANTAAAWA